MNVLVINQYAGNKGDRAVAYFVTRELDRNGVHSVVISTHDRSRWSKSGVLPGEGVRFVPWGWNCERSPGSNWLKRKVLGLHRRSGRWAYAVVRRWLLRSANPAPIRFLCNSQFYGALEEADLVLSTGGHHVTTLLAADAVSGQLYDMALALLAKKPLVLWSQSIGPLEFRKSENREFVRKVLDNASAVFVRDSQSRDELIGIDARLDHVRQTYESVIGLNDLVGGYTVPSRRAPVLGVAVYAAQRRGREMHDSYVRTLALLADDAIGMGFRVRFFPMEIRNGGSDDRPLIGDVLCRIRHTDSCSVVDEDLDTASHLAEVSKCRVFVGHKTHSVVFALVTGTPLVALAYHRKTTDFMNQYGLGEYCLCDASLTAGSLSRAFREILPRADEIGVQAFEQSRRLGVLVRNHFAEMIRDVSSG